MPKFLTIETAMRTFVGITLVQALLFVLIPKTVMGDVAEHPEYAEIIGLKEFSLMILYAAIIREKKTELVWMTVFGRLATIPLSFYMVFVVGAPTSFFGGVVLDIVFGSWTMAALFNDPSWRPAVAAAQRSKGSARRRSPIGIAILGSIGTIECVAGIAAIFQPTSVFGLDWLLPLASPPMNEPYIMMRAFGIMSMLLGMYQIRLAVHPQLSSHIWSALWQYHISYAIFVVVFSKFIASKPEPLALHAPLAHVVAGTMIALRNSLAA